jgi:hypothetical protein
LQPLREVSSHGPPTSACGRGLVDAVVEVLSMPSRMPPSSSCRCRRECRRRALVDAVVEGLSMPSRMPSSRQGHRGGRARHRGVRARPSCTTSRGASTCTVEADHVPSSSPSSRPRLSIASMPLAKPLRASLNAILGRRPTFSPLRRVPTSRPGASAGRFWRASKSRSTAGHRRSTSSGQPSRGGGCRGSTVMFMGERLEGGCRTPAGRLRRRPAGAGRRWWRMTSSPSAGAPSSLLGLRERSCRRRRGCVTSVTDFAASGGFGGCR